MQEKIIELFKVSEQLGQEGILFHEHIANQLGVHMTDSRALTVLRESPEGALPIGELSRKLHLSASATTSLVDRLESAGFVSRQPSRIDKRQTVAALERAAMLRANEEYRPMIAGMTSLYTEYTLEELEFLITFHKRCISIFQVAKAQQK
jgi:DNA-binding MarR family transcriptional regulator